MSRRKPGTPANIGHPPSKWLETGTFYSLVKGPDGQMLEKATEGVLLRAKCLELIARGLAVEAACGEILVLTKWVSRLPADTVWDWIKKGRAGQRPFNDFSEAYKLATGAQMALFQKTIARAAVGEDIKVGVQAASFHLERRFRKKFGPTIKTEQSGKPDPVDHEAMRAAIAKRLGVG